MSGEDGGWLANCLVAEEEMALEEEKQDKTGL
jgi:hypothetical protein